MQNSHSRTFIVSAPSGAGKTSLVKRTIAELDDLGVAVSHTTRPMRPGEVDGRDYHFVDRETFEAMIDDDRFLEYADVFGNYYGTSVAAVQELLDAGRDVILEIDWQGASQVRQKLSELVSIFVLPPSRAALIDRLRSRGQDADEVIERRTAEAVREMQQYHHADYLIVNDAFDEALAEMKAIILSHRVLRERQLQRHADLIASLTRD
ncbi:MAG: guanylate kinase [Gammaproteobacteria bacterium]|nr:MAG: guanylate kinase [Gammaproteobacteria bacterium]